MGLSIAISGGITVSVLVIILGIIFAISYQINTETLSNTESFEIKNSLKKTKMTIKNIEAESGNSIINFQLYNNSSKKLWNYEDFDVIITYDADISSVKTKITETLIYNKSASFTGIPTDHFLRPDGTAEGSWNQHVGCTNPTAYLCINEITRDDTDLINSTALGTNSFDPINFTLSDVLDPGIDTGHILRYTYSEANEGSNTPELIVSLYQGDTLIATRSELQPLPTSPTLASYTLNAISEVPLITDYSNLKLGFNATCDGACTNPGPTRDRVTITWAEIEIPDTLLIIPDIEPLEWAIAEIITDFFDPRIINEQEYAQIIGELTYPIYPSGKLEITISTDNGKIDNDSTIVT